MGTLQNDRGLRILERSLVSVVAYPGTVEYYPDDYVVLAKYLDMADAMRTVYDINNTQPEGRHRAFIVDTDGTVIGYRDQGQVDQEVTRCRGPLVC